MNGGEAITESDWLGNKDFYGMIEFMYERGRVRKLRLFGSACCRRLTVLPTVQRAMKAVGLAECYADGLVSEQEMLEASAASSRAVRWTRGEARSANVAASQTAGSLSYDTVCGLTNASTKAEGPYEPQRAAQYQLLSDVFGNPFRPVSINPILLTPTVTSLAVAAYEERIMPSGELDLERLAVLSDALEEAGCDNIDILNHLRGPGPHVRGCWVVDLLLGKE